MQEKEPHTAGTVDAGNHEDAIMETYDPNKNATEVRQASPRKMNLRVLTMSLIGIVIVFALIYFAFGMMQPATN